MLKLNVNNKSYTLELDPDTPLLWVLRDNLGFTGTKFGCGRSLCGACSVQVDGVAVRSCVTPVSSVVGKDVITIEGLNGPVIDRLRQAWISEQVPQCGYCHSGQLIAAEALLAKNSSPSDQQIEQAMAGNLCRCGTYQRIRSAIRVSMDLLKAEGDHG